MKIVMRLFIITFFLLDSTLLTRCLGQTSPHFPGDVGLSQVRDSILHAEISTFTIAGMSCYRPSTNVKLQALKLVRFGPNFITFDSPNFFGSSYIVTLYASNSVLNLERITFLIGEYNRDTIPDTALKDIPSPRLFEEYSLKKSKLKTNCKVLHSQNRDRTYIYMLNGSGPNRYEVTWVISNRKYLFRVIDEVPE